MIHNIFAMELCLRLEPGNGLRASLRDLVMRHPASTSPGPKWEMLKRAAALLLGHDELFEKGCWDYFDDDEKALNDYNMWCNGMITEEGARSRPSGSPTSNPGDPRYMTFTISLLIRAHTQTAHSLSKLCNIRQSDLWHRKSFVRILSGLTCVSFSAVKSDVYYLIPGDENWGLTARDLQDPKFHYLRQIEG